MMKKITSVSLIFIKLDSLNLHHNLYSCESGFFNVFYADVVYLKQDYERKF